MQGVQKIQRVTGGHGRARTRRDFLRIAAAGTAAVGAAPVLSACGAGEGADAGSGGRGKSIIRFAFAPDPVMDYLKDTATLAEFEERWGVRLAMTSSWDEFAFFAGGHGDIVSMSTTDIPLLIKQTGIPVVAFGRYNHTRLPILVRSDTSYQTMKDVVGKRVGIGNPVTSTTLLGNFVKAVHGLEFKNHGGDFEAVLNDHPLLPKMLARGDIDVAYTLPDFAFPELRKGELRGLYDGLVTWEFYEKYFVPGHEGVESNLFVARKDWYDKHPREIQFFLALWERGLELWQQNQKEIIGMYPQHFSVKEQEDIDFAVKYIAEHDWFDKTVYLDKNWIDGEVKVFNSLKKTGYMNSSNQAPHFDALKRDIPADIQGG